MRLVTTIDDIDTRSPNGMSRGSLGAMYADRNRVAGIKQTVYLRTLAMLGRRKVVGVPRVTLVRLSSAAKPMDRDNLIAALKPVVDGLAMGLGLDDDYELQERMTWARERCARGYKGVRIEVELDT